MWVVNKEPSQVTAPFFYSGYDAGTMMLQLQVRNQHPMSYLCISFSERFLGIHDLKSWLPYKQWASEHLAADFFFYTFFNYDFFNTLTKK